MSESKLNVNIRKATMSDPEILDVRNFKKHFAFICIYIALVVKSLFFLGIANNTDLSSYNFIKGFYSFDVPPSLITYSAFVIAILSFSYLFKGQLHFWYLFTLDALLSLLMVGDLMYYRSFGNFLSPYILGQTSNLDNLSQSMCSMLRPIDALFGLDIIFLLFLKKKRIVYYQEIKRSVTAFLALFIFSVATIYYQHYKIDIQNLEGNSLFHVDWVVNQTMTDLSPAGYHLYDLYNYYLENQTYELKPAEFEEIKLWLAQTEEDLPDNEFQGLFKGKNLVVIQVESLENFVVNQRVNDQEITPNLNRLIKNSLYFPNIYEQVYNGNSSDADLMFNTSVYPVRSGSTFFRFPMNTYNSLPNLMGKEGYTTLGIHSDKGSYWNWMKALNSIGFNKTFDSSHFNQDEIIGLGLSDGSYLSQVATLLVNEKEPFYAFMVTLTSHSPFELPEKHQELNLDDSLANSKLGGYFQSIRYTDREIGYFLEKLEKSQLLDNTVVVIYGDHTGVHKYYNDEIQQLKPREQWWLDDSKRIPFIIYSKSIEGQVFEINGGQIDLMPTLSYLFDLDQSYQRTAIGRNLLNTKKDFAILANREFIGTASNKSDKEFLLRGIDISDLIIRSNYYSNEGY
ncbi:MAG: LTA synthase family protein [Desulfitobacterium sp.]